jgi:hypothetical protein
LSNEALQNIGEQIADKWIGEAKNNAPIDKGFLTADITQRVEFIDGTWVINCYVPVNAPSASYAIKIHEEEYNLGANSLAKQAKGFEVGNKYIKRAMDDVQDDMPRIIEHEYRKVLK